MNFYGKSANPTETKYFWSIRRCSTCLSWAYSQWGHSIGLELAAKRIEFLGFMEISTKCNAIFMAKKTFQQTWAHDNLVGENLTDRKYSVTVGIGVMVGSNKALKL